jgi:hypothetical protein
VPEWRNWQTRMVQVHVLARVWGFESLLRHQASIIPFFGHFAPIHDRMFPRLRLPIVIRGPAPGELNNRLGGVVPKFPPGGDWCTVVAVTLINSLPLVPTRAQSLQEKFVAQSESIKDGFDV